MKEYPVSGYEQLLAFICGICSKDYDLTHIYIDSIFKVADNSDLNDLNTFVTKLDTFLKDTPITASIILSAKIDDLPEAVKSFC